MLRKKGASFNRHTKKYMTMSVCDLLMKDIIDEETARDLVVEDLIDNTGFVYSITMSLKKTLEDMETDEKNPTHTSGSDSDRFYISHMVRIRTMHINHGEMIAKGSVWVYSHLKDFDDVAALFGEFFDVRKYISDYMDRHGLEDFGQVSEFVYAKKKRQFAECRDPYLGSRHYSGPDEKTFYDIIGMVDEEHDVFYRTLPLAQENDPDAVKAAEEAADRTAEKIMRYFNVDMTPIKELCRLVMENADYVPVW